MREIINLSLITRTFKEALKEAVLRPLLRKLSLDPKVLANYRPVSRLPYLGKMVERVVVDQLQIFLENSSSLNPFQSGFWQGKVITREAGVQTHPPAG